MKEKAKKNKTLYAIEVNNLNKYFNVYYDKANTLKERILFFYRNKHEQKKVFENISLKIKKGETVALIGVNGCGKSTLLKLISKIIYPNSGEVLVNGKVASLIELGAGFHPDFTGRENIFFNASIFGLNKKEIESRLEQIIEFSELGEAIDVPIRTYSSGMYMRLAFSVAINVDADILLIDEILAVGDQRFQEKCMNKMLELKDQGKTMVFVSHSPQAVEFLCDRTVWLKDGVIRMDGPTKEVLPEYLKESGVE